VEPSELRGLTSALGDAPLLLTDTRPAGQQVTLGMLVGESGTFVERPGRPPEGRQQPLG
jgi:hypothetical protein